MDFLWIIPLSLGGVLVWIYVFAPQWIRCHFGFHVWGELNCPACGKRDNILADAFEKAWKDMPENKRNQIKKRMEEEE